MRCVLLAAVTVICVFGSTEDQLKRLSVVALDPEGQPVAGLQSADFQVLLDGKPQKIAFTRFTGDRSLPTAKLGPREYSNRAGAASCATVILLDLLNDRTMSGSEITEETARALKMVESSEGLYLYILAVSGRLYPVHPVPAPNTEVTPAEEPWTRNITAMLQSALKSVFSMKTVDDRDTMVRLDLTLRAMSDLASQMKQIPGRKNLVWVTHGIPLYGASISEQGMVDYSIPVRRVSQELSQAQIVVYPAQQSTRGAAAAMGTESEQTLDEFANLTGGRGYRSGRVDEAIRQAMTDSRANYQIAYYLAIPKPDGKHHKLRVLCTRKEVRLQTETGFYAFAQRVDPREIKHSAFEAALHSPFDATEIGMRASVSPDPDAKENVRFDVRIDPADLLLHQAQDRRTGKVSFWFAAFQGEAWNEPASPGMVAIHLTPEQYETVTRDWIEIRQMVRVSPLARKVRVLVVDEELGTIGSVTIPLPR